MDIIDTETLKTLTVAGARKLVKEPWGGNLKGLTRISDKVAEVLGTGVGALYLNGLSELSPRAAAALARRKGEVIQYSKRKTNDLILNGLTSISVESAKALAGYEGYLMLDGLTKLPDDVAAALAKFKGENLDLDGLQSISDKGLASLATSKTKGLSFGFKSISVTQAKILKAYKGDLGLSIKHLSTEVAAILGERRGKLYMPFLTSLSVGVAVGLANHKGYLDLNGLESLSAKAAWQLARHKGDIDFGEMKKLTKEAAKALAKVEGVVGLDGLETITPGVLAELAKRPDKLDLTGVTSLSEGVAPVLAKCPGYVYLSLKHLTDRQVEILLPKYAAGTLRLLGLYEGDQQMRVAWEEARRCGRWPFRKRKGN